MSNQALRQPFTPEEQNLYTQIFQSLDVEQLGIVTGDKARSTFEKSGLPPTVLGEIWQLADPTNLGFLNQFAFFVALRLIGHVQSGSKPDKSLIEAAGPIPRFAGIQSNQLQTPAVAHSTTGSVSSPSQLNPQLTSLPVLTNHDISKFSQLFAKNAPTGVISGEEARTIFLKAKLPTQVLGQIWNLVDKRGSGQLTKDEFVVAMYLIQNTLNGSITQLPSVIPQAIWDQVSGFQAPSSTGGSAGSIPSQRPPVSRVPSTFANASNDWVISAQKKQQFNAIFDGLDKDSRGVLGPNEVAPFLMTSKLPQDILATIWDLSDIHNSGEFTRDEFAIAMFLVQKKIAGVELPHVIPESLLPENHGEQTRQFSTTSSSSAVPQAAPKTIPQIPSRDTKPSAMDDLVDLNDVFTSSSPSVSLPDKQSRTISNSSVNYTPAPKAFVPSSSFGQGLVEKEAVSRHVAPAPAPALTVEPTTALQQKPTFTAPAATSTSSFKPIVVPTISLPFSSGSSRSAAPVNNDLLADSNPEVSGQLSKATTDLANLSNQIGSLTNQTSQLHDKRTRAEHELAKMTALKNDIESKLTGLRTAYDQEVQQTAEVEKLLSSVQSETEALRQDASIAEAQFNQAQNELQTVQKTLDEAQFENATLKEQLAAWNSQHAELQTQLEKAQSDVKQSRGFVSISTQQLDVNNIKSQELQQEIERLLSSTRELETHHDTILSKQQEIEEAAQSLDARKLQLEQSETEFTAREQEFIQRAEMQKQTQVLIEEQDSNLQQLVADLQSRKDQFDEAEAQLNKQQLEYAQRVQEFSYKQIQDATTGYGIVPTAEQAEPQSKDIATPDELTSSSLGSVAIGAVSAGLAVGVVTGAISDETTESEKENTQFSSPVENNTEQGTSVNSDYQFATNSQLNNLDAETGSLSSSVQNNAPQSVRDEIEEAEQDAIPTTENDEQPALASDVLTKDYNKTAEPNNETSGAGSFELIGEEAESESESTLRVQNEKFDEITTKDATTDELADDLESAIPGAWAAQDEDEGMESTTPVIAAAATLDETPIYNKEEVTDDVDDEFPPIKELEIDESDSEAEIDEFHETIDSFPSPAKKKIESTVSDTTSPVVPFVVTSALGEDLAKSHTTSQPDEFDEFAGLEEAKEETTADIKDADFADLDAAPEDSFADYDDEFDQQNFDQELEGNAFFGDDDEPATGGATQGGEDNEEWEQIFAGFGNQDQAAQPQLQHPQPTVNNGGGSNEPAKARIATTPRSLAVQELTGMGFTKDEALNALEKEKWNLEAATNFLLDNA